MTQIPPFPRLRYYLKYSLYHPFTVLHINPSASPLRDSLRIYIITLRFNQLPFSLPYTISLYPSPAATTHTSTSTSTSNLTARILVRYWIHHQLHRVEARGNFFLLQGDLQAHSVLRKSCAKGRLILGLYNQLFRSAPLCSCGIYMSWEVCCFVPTYGFGTGGLAQYSCCQCSPGVSVRG